jgi:hypothetical protein
MKIKSFPRVHFRRFNRGIPCLLLFVIPLGNFPGQAANEKVPPIDREALVNRHAVIVEKADSMASLSVGNGNLAFTVDVTGLQTFPEAYVQGVPLGTQSQWGWHHFPNVNGYQPRETWKAYYYHGKEEWYAVQFDEPGRSKEAADYFRANPHRLHLGLIGLDIKLENGKPASLASLSRIHQRLDMWNGWITSSFQIEKKSVKVKTACLPEEDRIVAEVVSPLFKGHRLSVKFQFPYPSGKHTDDGCDWTRPDLHQTLLVKQSASEVWLKRIIDEDSYYVYIQWEGKARFEKRAAHDFRLIPEGERLAFSCHFLPQMPLEKSAASGLKSASAKLRVNQDLIKTAAWWHSFWKRGGAVDFSQCLHPRAF